MRLKYFYPWGWFHPINCGAAIVARNHLCYFAERGWRVDMIIGGTPADKTGEKEFRQEYPQVDRITPLDWYGAAWRMRDMLYGFDKAANNRLIRDALEEPADACLFNYVFATPLLTHVPGSCVRILETVDLMTNQFGLAEVPPNENGQRQISAVDIARWKYQSKLEERLYDLYDAVVMINPEEMGKLSPAIKQKIHYIPQWYNEPESHEEPADITTDLLIVASDNPVNHRGIEWFYRRIYIPYLWKNGIRLSIAGSVCNRLTYRDFGVTLLGTVPGSLTKIYRSSKAALIPILEGTGLSIKTLEALSMGKPVITTQCGVRGMKEIDNSVLRIDMKSNPSLIATQILDFLNDEAELRRLEKAAKRYIRRHFSRSSFYDSWDTILRSLRLMKSELEQYRESG